MSNAQTQFKATLSRAPGYNVKVGDTDLGYFHETGDWEGMKRLVNAKNEVLIVDDGTTGAAGSFTGIFAPRETTEVTVVKLSVSLAAHLLTPKAPAEPGGAAAPGTAAETQAS